MKLKCFLLLLLLIPLFNLHAQEEFSPIQGDMGLVFQFMNIPVNFASYDDGYAAGAGFKYVFLDVLHGRALLLVDVDPNGADPAVTTFGLGAAVEYHFIPGTVSPYAGGLAGTRLLFENATVAADIYFGAIGGVEVSLLKTISAYAEYNALCTIDEDGFGFNLGSDVRLGAVIYF